MKPPPHIWVQVNVDYLHNLFNPANAAVKISCIQQISLEHLADNNQTSWNISGVYEMERVASIVLLSAGTPFI